MPWAARLGLEAGAVADARPAVAQVVGVQRLAPAPGARQADAVAVARYRREVAHADEHVLARARLAREGDDVAVGVVGLQPVEALGLVVEPPQRALVAIDRVE